MKFDGITITTDMDGTLLTGDKKISDKNRDAIEYFRKNGGTFTIASGRIYPKVLMYADELKLDAPFISNNGSVIYDYKTKSVIYKKTLDKKAIDVLKKLMKDFPDYGFEVASLGEVLFLRDGEYVRKHIKDESFTDLKWITPDEINFEMTKILIAQSPEKIDKLSELIPSEYCGFSAFRSDKFYFELGGLGVSKGSALSKLKNILGEKAQKIYAVGDAINDLEMIKEGDFGVAVKNALPYLKENADFILPYTNEESAIAGLIELIEKGTV